MNVLLYGKMSFLHVLLMRSNEKLESIVFYKETNNDIYLHCEVFCSYYMVKGTLRTLVRCDYTVFSSNNLLYEELHHIETCFTESNGYPK